VLEGTGTAEDALLHRDACRTPVSQVTMAHRTASREVDFFSTSCRDITGQKKAARERELLPETERAVASALEAGRRRLELLDGASRVLGSSLDYEQTLANVVRLVVPHFADLCGIHLVSGDG